MYVVGVQVQCVRSQYCTGSDHHGAQMGGVIWPSLRPSLETWRVKAWGLGTLYDGCLLEVNEAQPQMHKFTDSQIKSQVVIMNTVNNLLCDCCFYLLGSNIPVQPY